MYFKLAIGNVRKSLRDYGIYFLTLVFGVCVFYAFNSISAQEAALVFSESQHRIMQLLAGLLSGVSVFIALVLGFLIVYASRYLVRRRKKEFGTYLTLGMPVGKVSRIIVYETMLVGLISLLVGLALGVLVSQLLIHVSAALFTVSMDGLKFVFSTSAMIQTMVYFAVIFLFTMLFNVVTISRCKLIDLLSAERKNEDIKLRLPVGWARRSLITLICWEHLSVMCLSGASW
jgi:putative ABC transport system permease protein